jgi:hypothetical protein
MRKPNFPDAVRRDAVRANNSDEHHLRILSVTVAVLKDGF